LNWQISETVTFIIASVAAGAYYAMWSGFGVTKKGEVGGEERFIFWGRCAPNPKP
jgi:hypothetical protein